MCIFLFLILIFLHYNNKVKYKIFKNRIEIENDGTFSVKKSLQCGQLFRYEISGDKFILFEGENKIEIEESEKTIKIFTKTPKQHINYFDLDSDYAKINARISKINPQIKKAVNFGLGIRIFNQGFVETVISFIISANNNIPRIRKSLFMLCKNYGANKGDYFAFPSLSVLSKITKEQWEELGVGYRAKSLVKATQQLSLLSYQELKNAQTSVARKKLIELAGVGPKVADCILLFGLEKKDVFPTDTWVKKFFLENFKEAESDAKKISQILSSRFGEDSGLIQQYIFYYKREKGDFYE